MTLGWVLAGGVDGGTVLEPTTDMIVNPGDDLATKINALGAGQSVLIRPGKYRITSKLVPKTGQTWHMSIGGETIISGSQAFINANWTAETGRWYASATFSTRDSTMRDSTHSVCDITSIDGTNLCWDREQVYYNGQRMKRVALLGAGDAYGAGSFFTDRSTNRVYVWSNPIDNLVEMCKTDYVVNSSVPDVTWYGGTIEHFASPIQMGALVIDTASGWKVIGTKFQNNHMAGVHTTNATNYLFQYCSFIDNGQMGFTDHGTSGIFTFSNNIIDSCVFSGNNREDFYIGDWEAGGFKSSSDRGGIVKNCTFTDDRGLALWVDFGSNWVFDNNTINSPWAQAIRIEVAFNCIVRFNDITNSGHNIGDLYRHIHQAPSTWYAPADTCAIGISESSYVEVYGNSVSDPCLNGIVVLCRGRTTASASGGDHIFVHDNDVEQRQAPINVDSNQNTTNGTMIAGGLLLAGAPQSLAYYTASATWSMPNVGPYSGSGKTANRLIDVRENSYKVGSMSTKRFAWGSYTYVTGTTYSSSNPTDAGSIVL